MRWHIIVLVLYIALSSSRCKAHTRMVYPTPRSSDPGLKTSPCGGVSGTAAGTPWTTLEAGKQITVEFEETINHPGWFRLAFSYGGDNTFDEYVFVDYIEHNASVPTPRKYTAQVVVPNIECTRENACAMQVIQVMTDKPKMDGEFQKYFSCSNVEITKTSQLISAFNVQVFGQSKIGKPGVATNLSRIVQWYDMLLFQEIRDASGDAIVQLDTLINNDTNSAVGALDRYNMTLGPRLGRTNSKEQYAIFYRTDEFDLLDVYTYNDDEKDVFEREPIVAEFRVLRGKHTGLRFHVIGIHIAPDDAVEELTELVRVYDNVVNKSRNTNAFIMGDFNADCSYVSKTELANLTLFNTPDKFKSLIGDNADTTVSDTDCAYDRIVVAGAALQAAMVPDSGRVVRYDLIKGLTQDEAKLISDHYPVEARLDYGDDAIAPTSTPTPTSTPAPSATATPACGACPSDRYAMKNVCECVCKSPFHSGRTCEDVEVAFIVAGGMTANEVVTQVAGDINVPASSLVVGKTEAYSSGDRLVSLTIRGTVSLLPEQQVEAILASPTLQNKMNYRAVWLGDTSLCETYISVNNTCGGTDNTCVNGECSTLASALQEYPVTPTTTASIAPSTSVPVTPKPDDDGDKGTSPGIYVALIAGALLLLGGIVGAIVFVARRSPRSTKSAMSPRELHDVAL